MSSTLTPGTEFIHPLKNRAIIVTGAASGIGRSVALHLAMAGARLALTDVDPDGGRKVCEEIKDLGGQVDVVFAKLDVTDEEAIGKLVRTFLKTYKRLDGLVNCAGINPHVPATHQLPFEEYLKIQSTNTAGTYAFCQHFLLSIVGPNVAPREPPRGGYSIVNIGSIASLTGIAQSSAYCTSKHAVLGLSRSLAREYGPKQIRVNTVCPGFVDTPLLEDKFEPSELTVQEAVEEARVPLGRIADPEEVATAVLFLLGPEASYITGVALPVDGGWNC